MQPFRTLKDPGQYRESLSMDSLYRAHGERDFGNPAWDGALARFLVVRLSPFRDVERSTPHLFLYREIRQAMPDAYVDFAFLPTARDRAWLGANGVPPLHGIASARGGADFDVILVSNSYALELVNLAGLLGESGVPATRNGREGPRREAGGHPLVVLGGSNAFASAAIHRWEPDGTASDSLVDAVFFGEAEGAIGDLARGLAAAARAPDRAAALDSLAAATPGLWHTRTLAPVSRARALPTGFPRVPPPILAGEEAATARLELTRGCPGFCTFCFEGWERKPYRERPPADVLDEARFLRDHTGAVDLELTSYDFCARSDLVLVLRELGRLFGSVSAMSQRVDALAASPALARAEAASGKRSFTLGVEGVSERMRAYYGKGLVEGQILAAVSAVMATGPRELKLFYIVSGLETGGDLDEFSGFLDRLKERIEAAGHPPRVVFSVGLLVRMPFTPLAYERLLLDPGDYAAVMARIESALAGRGFEYRSPGRFDEYALSQVLVMAPPGCFDLLLAMAERGFSYERSLLRGAWEFARARLERDGALGPHFTGEKPEDHPFRYGFVETAADRRAVYARWLEARAGRERPTCLGGRCAACGACDDEERDFLLHHAREPVREADIDAIMAEARRRPVELVVPAVLPREAAGAPPAYWSALFARKLREEVPGMADQLLGVDDVLLGSEDGRRRLPGGHGPTWVCLRCRGAAAADILAAGGYEVLYAAPGPSSMSAVASFPGTDPAAAAVLFGMFLDAVLVPHTLAKAGGAYSFRVSDRGRKRRNVLSAELSSDGAGGARAVLELGPKYDLGPLADQAGRRRAFLDLEVTAILATREDR